MLCCSDTRLGGIDHGSTALVTGISDSLFLDSFKDNKNTFFISTKFSSLEDCDEDLESLQIYTEECLERVVMWKLNQQREEPEDSPEKTSTHLAGL